MTIPENLQNDIVRLRVLGVPKDKIMLYVWREMQKQGLNQQTTESQVRNAQENLNYVQSAELQPKEQKKPSLLKRIGVGIAKTFTPLGETLGEATATMSKDYKEAAKSQEQLDDMNMKLAEAIIAGKKQGKDTSRLEKLYQENTGRVFKPEEIIPSLKKTTKQIAGEAATTALTAATFGETPGLSALGTVKQAGLIGGAYGAAGAAQEGKEDLVVPALKGAAIGFAVGGLFKGAGKLYRTIKNRPPITAERALQIPKSEIRARIRYKQEPIGDILLKYKYRGNVNDVINKAEMLKEKSGLELEKALNKYKHIKVSKNEIYRKMNDVFEEVPDSNLRKAYRKVIDKYIKEKLTIPELNLAKQNIAKEIYQTKRKTQLFGKKEFMQDLWRTLRDLIDEKVGNNIVKKANKKWSDAQTIYELANDLYAAERAGSRPNISFWQMLTKLYYKTLMNTRNRLFFANTLNTINKLTPSTLPAIEKQAGATAAAITNK